MVMKEGEGAGRIVIHSSTMVGHARPPFDYENGWANMAALNDIFITNGS